MSLADLFDGGFVVALSVAIALAELVGRRPEFLEVVFRTKPGRSYLAVNAIAGLAAFGLALLLDIHFTDPDRLWLVLTCGLAGATVLRSAPVTGSGLAGPAKILLTLRTAYDEQLNRTVQVRAAKAADDAVDGLAWNSDKEALGAMCLTISERDTADERSAMAERIKKASESDLPDQVRMYSLAVTLARDFGIEILREAAKKVRQVKGGSEPE